MDQNQHTWWNHAPLVDLKNLSQFSESAQHKVTESETCVDSETNKDSSNHTKDDDASIDTECHSDLDQGKYDATNSSITSTIADDESSATVIEVGGQVKKDPDVLIFHGTIVHSTPHSAMEILTDHVIVVKDGLIKYLEPADRLPDLVNNLIEYEIDVIHLHEGSFLMPGFVDVHAHLSKHGFVGAFPESSEKSHTNDSHQRKPLHDDRYVRKMARSAIRRSINNGTTCAAYISSSSESFTRVFCSVLDDMHQRAVLGLELHLLEAREDIHMLQLIKAVDVIRSIRQKRNRLLTPYITSMLPFPDALEKKIAETCRKEDVLFQVNVRENTPTICNLNQWLKLDESQIKHHNENGILTKKTILLLCSNCSEEEFSIIRNSGASVVHCPHTSINAMHDICDVKKLLDMGINIGLGTVGSSPSMLDTIRRCVQLAKILQLSRENNNSIKSQISNQLKILRDEMKGQISEPTKVVFRNIQDSLRPKSDVKDLTPFNLKEAFRLATLGGATALNLEDSIGNFEIDKEFDAFIVDPFVSNSPFDTFLEHGSIEDIIENFIVMGDDRNITHVYISGTRVK